MKFRKRPVVIEAWHNEKGNPIPDWIQGRGVGGAGGILTLVTLEGVMTASPDDWIIQGIKGEIYPIKPDIFAATYELLEDPKITVHRYKKKILNVWPHLDGGWQQCEYPRRHDNPDYEHAIAVVGPVIRAPKQRATITRRKG